MIHPLPFTTSTVKAVQEMELPWFHHPLKLMCPCDMAMHFRRFKDATTFTTRFECSNIKCGKVLIFMDSHYMDK